MKKILLLLCAIATVAVVSCKKNDGGGDTPKTVALLSFGFRAADNTNLSSDAVLDKISGNSFTVILPMDFDSEGMKTLKPYFASSEQTKVYIDGKEIVSGQTVCDFSNPCDILVTDGGKANASYSVTVKIQSAKWTKLGFSELKMGNEPAISINPVDGMPYLLGYAKGKDTDHYYPSLIKLEGKSVVTVADSLIKERASYMSLNFLNDGTAFISLGNFTLADGTIKSVVQRTQVYKMSGKEAVQLGGDFSKMSGNGVTSNAVIPISSDKVYNACMNSAAITGCGKRCLNFAEYSSGSWAEAQPISSRDMSQATYIVLTRTKNKIPYLYVLNFADVSLSVYSYKNGIWGTEFEQMKPVMADGLTPITTADYQYSSQDFDIASNGDIYVLASADFETAGSKEYAVVRAYYDKESVSWKQEIVGGVIKTTTHAKSRYISLALDKFDTPFVVWSNAIDPTTVSTSVIYLDKKTKQWSEPSVLTTAKTEGAVIRFNEQGEGFIAYHDLSEGNTESDSYVIYSNK